MCEIIAVYSWIADKILHPTLSFSPILSFLAFEHCSCPSPREQIFEVGGAKTFPWREWEKWMKNVIGLLCSLQRNVLSSPGILLKVLHLLWFVIIEFGGGSKLKMRRKATMIKLPWDRVNYGIFLDSSICLWTSDKNWPSPCYDNKLQKWK